MQKLIKASLILFVLVVLQNSVFASTLDCKFSKDGVEGVEVIELTNDNLIINHDLEIPLEKSRVKCGNFGRQVRFDGSALGYQVILKSCTSDAKLEGHLIDAINEVAAEVHCFSSDF